ncbi:MAG: class I SAM-dependent methyltransferase [Myxococcota bacterium]
MRNLAVFGILGIFLGQLGRLLPGVGFLGFLFFPGISMAASAAWMVFGSKVLKLKARDRLFDRLALSGSERVLDAGCGRGLLLIGAAKRLPSGQAVGVDLWRTVDQSGNHPDVTKQNAAAEGVAERIQIETGDLMALPFPDASFDAVVSSWAIHNIPNAEGREKCLAEIRRVLKPGGRVELLDIGPGAGYAASFSAAGFLEVERGLDTVAFFIPTWRTRAKKPPG